jgi:hypothetical protein
MKHPFTAFIRRALRCAAGTLGICLLTTDLYAQEAGAGKAADQVPQFVPAPSVVKHVGRQIVIQPAAPVQAKCYEPAAPGLQVLDANYGPVQGQQEFCATATFYCTVTGVNYGTPVYSWSINGMAAWPSGYTVTPTGPGTATVTVSQPWTPPQIQPIFDIVCDIDAPGFCHPIRVRLNDLRMRTTRDCLQNEPEPQWRAAAYPNPATDQLTLQGEVAEAVLLDLRGLPRRRFEAAARTLSVRDLPAGIYYLRLVQKNGQVRTQRIEVQH